MDVGKSVLLHGDFGINQIKSLVKIPAHSPY